MAGQETTNTGSVKLLSLVWFKVLPPEFGGQKAVAFFNEYISNHAPLLCLCASSNETADTSYPVQNTLPVGKSSVLNPFAWRTIYRVAKREGATHLLLEFPYYGLAGILCQKLLRIKLIVNAHNVEYLRFKEQKKWWWRGLFFVEKRTLKAADAVFFKTEDDLKTAQKNFGLCLEKLSVVPYGVEKMKGRNKALAQAKIRKRHAIKDDERILLFAGTLDYGPNAEAVVAVCETLIPLLNQTPLSYKIIVCGRNRMASFACLNLLQNKSLVMVGEVANIEAYFEAADVFMNPVLTGGGVQTKTMDALSYHLTVVCFAAKAKGIAKAANKIFAVIDGDWPAFAKAVAEALQKDEPTPPAFFETYNWRSIAAEAYQKILAC